MSGLPVLGADGHELPTLREAALDRGLLVVALPVAGQETTDYEAFRDVVGRTASGELGYLAVLVSGAAKPVRAVTGSPALLR